MKKSTQVKQFSKITIEKIIERDQGCIFCKNYLFMPTTPRYEQQIHDIMHIVNKSQGGLGIEENGVLGCRYHHSMMDNGNTDNAIQMREFARNYLISIYPNWSIEQCKYDKWK